MSCRAGPSFGGALKLNKNELLRDSAKVALGGAKSQVSS
jgi:hypothetical protein